MVKRIKFIFHIILCFLFFACTKINEAKLNSFKGYMAWKQNDWTNASSSFLDSLVIAENINNEEIKIYSNFGIGSTYLMQNEDSSAIKRFEDIKDSKNMQLNSFVNYQRGIIAFKSKRYDEAAYFFKRSLEFMPNSIDAKINYELSKKYSTKAENKSQNTEAKNIAEQKETVFDKTIINLIQKKGEKEWPNFQQEKNPPAYDF